MLLPLSMAKVQLSSYVYLLCTLNSNNEYP